MSTKPRGEMFIQVPTDLLNCSGLSHGAKLAYGRLKLHAGKNGRTWVSDKKLAAELGVCERQLRNYLRELTRLRRIRREERPGTTSLTYITPSDDAGRQERDAGRLFPGTEAASFRGERQ